jgi:serine/threonine-protein kinase
VKLAAGSSESTVLPFTGLMEPVGVAVDSVGAVYVTASLDRQVLKLPAGSFTPTVWLGPPWVASRMSVDTADNVYLTEARLYVSDDSDVSVLKMDPAAEEVTALPFTGLENPAGVAVDAAGTVYITDVGNGRVLKLPAGALTPTELPFTGLKFPRGVAVDSAGTVYVADEGNDRVVALPTA